MQKIASSVVILVFASLASVVPGVLLWVGLKKTGIDLHSALASPFTVEAFKGLIVGTGYAEVNFRAAMCRSVFYAAVASFVATGFSFYYVLYVSVWSKKAALKMSFTMLSLVLLPTMYLILPSLILISIFHVALPRKYIIIFMEFISLLPFLAWVFYSISFNMLQELLCATALDNYGPIRASIAIFREIKIDAGVVFCFGCAIAWGNYLIPYFFGDRNSYSALVELISFSSNVGRDWAMISAAGIFVMVPSLVGVCAIAFLWHKRTVNK